jgi:hypothetical protein
MPLDVGAYVGGGMSLSHRSIRLAWQAAPLFLPLGNGRTLRSSISDGEPVVLALFARGYRLRLEPDRDGHAGAVPIVGHDGRVQIERLAGPEAGVGELATALRAAGRALLRAPSFFMVDDPHVSAVGAKGVQSACAIFQ